MCQLEVHIREATALQRWYANGPREGRCLFYILFELRIRINYEALSRVACDDGHQG